MRKNRKSVPNPPNPPKPTRGALGSPLDFSAPRRSAGNLTLADVAAIEWNCGPDDEVRSIPVDVLIAVLSFAEARWFLKSTGWARLIDPEAISGRLHILRDALDHLVGEGGSLDNSGVDQVFDKLDDITAQADAQTCQWRKPEFHRNYRIIRRQSAKVQP